MRLAAGYDIIRDIFATINRQQLGDEFEMPFTIPWRHHVEIFTHAKSVDEALF